MGTRHVFAFLVASAAVVALVGCSGEEAPGSRSSVGGETLAPSASTGDGSILGTTARRKPKADVDLLHPVVEIKTSHGAITVRLDAEHAPITVSNFLAYVNSSHYDATIFHYVDEGAMILGGGFTVDLEPKQGFGPIRNEAHNGLKNKRGTIAMSRYPDSIDSATCQFFINVADNPNFDFRKPTQDGYGYCVFGEVTAGMEVVEQVAKSQVEDRDDFVNLPREQVVIKKMRKIR